MPVKIIENNKIFNELVKKYHYIPIRIIVDIYNEGRNQFAQEYLTFLINFKKEYKYDISGFGFRIFKEKLEKEMEEKENENKIQANETDQQ